MAVTENIIDSLGLRGKEVKFQIKEQLFQGGRVKKYYEGSIYDSVLYTTFINSGDNESETIIWDDITESLGYFKYTPDSDYSEAMNKIFFNGQYIGSSSESPYDYSFKHHQSNAKWNYSYFVFELNTDTTGNFFEIYINPNRDYKEHKINGTISFGKNVGIYQGCDDGGGLFSIVTDIAKQKEYYDFLNELFDFTIVESDNINLKAYIQNLVNIVGAKTGKTGKINAQDLGTEIANISGGVAPTGTVSITENGTHDVSGYAKANVAVINEGNAIVTSLGSVTGTAVPVTGEYYVDGEIVTEETEGVYKNTVNKIYLNRNMSKEEVLDIIVNAGLANVYYEGQYYMVCTGYDTDTESEAGVVIINYGGLGCIYLISTSLDIPSDADEAASTVIFGAAVEGNAYDITDEYLEENFGFSGWNPNLFTNGEIDTSSFDAMINQHISSSEEPEETIATCKSINQKLSTLISSAPFKTSGAKTVVLSGEYDGSTVSVASGKWKGTPVPIGEKVEKLYVNLNLSTDELINICRNNSKANDGLFVLSGNLFTVGNWSMITVWCTYYNLYQICIHNKETDTDYVLFEYCSDTGNGTSVYQRNFKYLSLLENFSRTTSEETWFSYPSAETYHDANGHHYTWNEDISNLPTRSGNGTYGFVGNDNTLPLFECNGINYYNFFVTETYENETSYLEMKYDDTIVWNSTDGWLDDKYREIKFSDENNLSVKCNYGTEESTSVSMWNLINYGTIYDINDTGFNNKNISHFFSITKIKREAISTVDLTEYIDNEQLPLELDLSAGSENIIVGENGIYDTKGISSVEVEVPLPEGNIDINENGAYDINDFKTAEVSVLPKLNIHIGTDEPEDTSKLWVYSSGDYSKIEIRPTDDLIKLYDLDVKLPVAARRVMCAAVGTKIYLFGGSTGSEYLNTINVFDTETNTIETLSVVLPTDICAAACAAVGTKIYLFGGATNNSSELLNTINVFDTETNTIETLDITLPVYIYRLTCATVGTKIYLFGGYSGTNSTSTSLNYNKDIIIIDTETNTIETLNKAFDSKSGEDLCCGVINDTTILIYGVDDYKYTFDTTTNTLSSEYGKYDFYGSSKSSACGVIDNVCYFFGGTNGDIKIYDQTISTSCYGSISSAFHTNTSNIACVTINNKCYLFGGETGDEVIDNIRIFEGYEKIDSDTLVLTRDLSKQSFKLMEYDNVIMYESIGRVYYRGYFAVPTSYSTKIYNGEEWVINNGEEWVARK